MAAAGYPQGLAMSLEWTIDLMKVPPNLWGRRKYLLSEFLPIVLELSTHYVRETYKSREQLEASCWFVENDLTHVPPADYELLETMWFFPWREAQHEMSVALDQALMGFQRASVDHQRRSLELILVGTWFVSRQTTEADARAWMTARSKTPFFSRILKLLSKEDLFAELEAETNWVNDVQEFYWRLCDISHVRGAPHGFRTVQPSRFSWNGSTVPEYAEEALEKTLDSFIATVSYIVLLAALSNPVLLFGLPVEQKFGTNPPATGVFEDWQCEHFRALIPKKHQKALVVLADTHDRVRGMRDFFSSRPDVTAEELEKQLKEFDERFPRTEGSRRWRG
ncbi:MAG: hypothetical protein OXI33_04890 [Chloroflexota bacterium]|nr:hypothetical protein [Chloroflexota bacterium]